MRRRAAAVAILLAGCGGERIPAQPPEAIATTFRAAIRACSAGLTATGSIDQAAMRALGWRVLSRSTRVDGQDRSWPLDAAPVVPPGGYEVTMWERADLAGRIELIRSDGIPTSLHDACHVMARAEDDGGARRVVDLVTAAFGRPPDRSGTRPRGGDFLTPRFDTASFSRYWALPRSDVYVITGEDGFLQLEVVAMADRAAVDRFSPDRPEHRIPTQEGPS